jgi:hypothetical protein
MHIIFFLRDCIKDVKSHRRSPPMYRNLIQFCQLYIIKLYFRIIRMRPLVSKVATAWEVSH